MRPLRKQLGMYWRQLIILLIAGLSWQLANAQTAKLIGKVINEKQEAISGATVKVEGTSLVMATSVDGSFSFDLTPGPKYTIEVSAIGHETKKISEVDVVAGKANDITIVLNISSKAQNEVVIRTVSRRQENTTAMITFQKNNTALSSGLAADFIARTPDRNTGEVLKRVSGASIQDNKYVVVRGLSDRYNQALINDAPMPSSEPDKKAFSFDMIPSSMIDNIIINKTATPDLPGEFAGGLVQINTKDRREILKIMVRLGAVHGSWFMVHGRVLHFVVFLSFQIWGFFTSTINIPCSIFGVGAHGFMVDGSWFMVDGFMAC